jgi:hypothetical protein
MNFKNIIGIARTLPETTTQEPQPPQRPPATQEPSGTAEIQDSIEQATPSNFLNLTPLVPVNTSDTGPAGLQRIETTPDDIQGLNTELPDSNQSVASRLGVTMGEMGTASVEDSWSRCLDLIAQIRDMINNLPPDLQAQAKSNFQTLLQSLYPMIDAANPGTESQINDINTSLEEVAQNGLPQSQGDAIDVLEQSLAPGAPSPAVPPDVLAFLKQFVEQIQAMTS